MRRGAAPSPLAMATVNALAPLRTGGGRTRSGSRVRRLPVAAAIVSALLTAGTAEATVAARSTRFGGDDRFETVRLVAEATYDDAPVALLASGLSHGDAITASYVSGGLRAPVLLTAPHRLPDGTLDTLERLGTSRVVVVGGPGAVSDSVLAELEDAGMTTSRIFGESRYHTARKLAGTFSSSTIGEVDGQRAAVVVTGEGFADALSVAPISSSRGVPILLTPRASLHVEAEAALRELDIERVVVVGGEGAVGPGVIDRIRTLGVSVRRIEGASRLLTAIAVAEFASGELGYPMNRILLARADDYADALAGGTRGGRLLAPVLLVATEDLLGDDLRSYIRAQFDTLSEIDVLGGPGVISQAVADDAVAAARGR